MSDTIQMVCSVLDTSDIAHLCQASTNNLHICSKNFNVTKCDNPENTMNSEVRTDTGCMQKIIEH